VVARRLLLLLAVLMLMAALAAQISPPPERTTRSTPAPTPAPEVTAEPAAPDPDVIAKTIPVGGDGTVIVDASVGDNLRLTFESDALATVEIPDLDKVEAVQPESPAIVDLYLDRAGSFPIVVLESSREIARLEVAAG
jgi:hypothetical protein